MHPFKIIFFLAIGVAAALPALADTRATVEIGDLQFSVGDLRPDDGLEAVGLLSGWYGGAMTYRHGFPSPHIKDERGFNSLLPETVEARFQSSGLDARVGTDGVGIVRTAITGSTAGLMTDPEHYWTEQYLYGQAVGKLGFYLGPYSSVTLTLNGRTEILRTNPELPTFRASTYYALSSEAQSYSHHVNLWGGEQPPSVHEQLMTFTLVNNRGSGAIQFIEIMGYTSIMASQVPEPSTIGMLGAGLALLWWRRRAAS